MKAGLRCIVVACVLLAAACSPSPEHIREKLEQLAASDLKDILSDMSQRGLDSLISDQPRYEVSQFTVFERDSSRVIGAYGEVCFFYLNRLKLHQLRKYRFNAATGMWERYEVKIKHTFSFEKGIRDSLDKPGKGPDS